MQIRSEMTANVWKVLVSEGDTIEADQEIVILESMKMEIPVPAETSGSLTRLAVAEGDTLNEGDLIAVIGDRA